MVNQLAICHNILKIDGTYSHGLNLLISNYTLAILLEIENILVLRQRHL